ncbi:MAG: flap endonuclease [Proteobacteria bacterium]|nr:flap endonuclease [Pseudomonadota bacterium]
MSAAVHLYLVDGTFELFRCFHGAPRAKDADGNEFGATRAMLWTLTKLLRRDGLTHVAFAMDRMTRPIKKDGSADALLREQNGPVADVVRALGIALLPMSRFQADAALATGAAHWGDTVDRTVTCTRDKDLLQCVRGDRIVLLDRTKKVITDEAALRERFGIGPEQIPDYHALVGNPSDGLAGLPGWGPKATAAALQRWPGVEQIPTDFAAWEGVPIRGARRLHGVLVERRLELLLARNLSVRRGDVPLPHSLDDLRWRGPTDALPALAARLGAEEALDRVPAPR